jgi:hypothetical protein
MVSVARTSRGLLPNIDRGVSNGQFRQWSGGISDGESVPVIYEQ